MGIFKRKKIGEITDIDELFEVLSKRKYWNRIPSDILLNIFSNAGGDTEKIGRFQFVSEQHHCVENNFIPISSENDDPKMVLALFSVTLERLGAQAAQSIPNLPEGSLEKNAAIETTEFAFMSSILCNPLMLPSYSNVAILYMMLGYSDRAAEVCRDYDIAEHKLHTSNNNELGYYNLAMKSESDKFRLVFNQIKADLSAEAKLAPKDVGERIRTTSNRLIVDKKYNTMVSTDIGVKQYSLVIIQRDDDEIYYRFIDGEHESGTWRRNSRDVHKASVSVENEVEWFAAFGHAAIGGVVYANQESR